MNGLPCINWNCYCPGGIRERYSPYIPPREKSLSISATDYDPQMALLLVTLCYQMYFQWANGYFTLPVWPQKYETVGLFKGPSFTNPEDIGAVLQTTDKIIVVFRGTRNMMDTLQDLNAFRVPYALVPDGGQVHQGFYHLYTDSLPGGSMREQVLSLLANMDVNKRLYITGHSLGGALATLNALDVAVNSKFKEPTVYTYGSPRTGDRAFCKQFNKTLQARSIRVDNTYDIVPDLPPCQLGYGEVRNKYELNVDAGNPAVNHDIVTAYYPGLAKSDPTFAKDLCSNNVPAFCPKPLAPEFLVPILYPENPETKCIRKR